MSSEAVGRPAATETSSGRTSSDDLGPRGEASGRRRGDRHPGDLHPVGPATVAGSSFIEPTKRATKALRRMAVDLGRGAELLEPAVRHHADPIGDAERLLLVVGDEQRRDAELGLDAADLVAQRAARTLASSADSGSSSSSTSGWMASARASATRCCWPPDSWCG